ncbi:hypothetical protein ABAC460_04385 [Asticcacaulis sp. AC460]|uniref:CAF17-like 4Fe-4S cluster assembly/insertion protein YgfZ n=1 Tax=Asticcacaulis sp. AC460 TaxID=1282360 RepID=UPI0003C3B4FA|nr:folate-binding protein YgfZ [Asticcacaulis sp. AC460]ESQ92130.1 hypothetical protein ABAC460_04385 [Asticcacaulis sp. AC460]
MYADCLLSPRSADEVWLDVPQTAREELLAKLNMYKLRAKVTIEPLDLAVHAAFDGSLPEAFAADPRGEVIGAGFGWSYDPQPADATADDWTQFRYRHGLAEAGSDFSKDELYAIDANLDLLDGIDFKKGCYVGQELTSRMKRRGQIKNRVLPLRHDGKLPTGGEVLIGDRRAGEVLGSIDGASLALMRLDRLDGDLICDGTPLNLTIPGWIAPHISTEAA